MAKALSRTSTHDLRGLARAAACGRLRGAVSSQSIGVRVGSVQNVAAPLERIS